MQADRISPAVRKYLRPPTERAVLDTMRSGEWLRTQWIARCLYDLENGWRPNGWGPEAHRVTERVLRQLEKHGFVESRSVKEIRKPTSDFPIGFEIPRDEWRVL